MAVLDGIQNKIDPGEPLDKDIYDLSPEELKDVPQGAGLARRGARRAGEGPRVPAQGRRVHGGRDRRPGSTTSARTRSTPSACARTRTSSRCTSTTDRLRTPSDLVGAVPIDEAGRPRFPSRGPASFLREASICRRTVAKSLTGRIRAGLRFESAEARNAPQNLMDGLSFSDRAARSMWRILPKARLSGAIGWGASRRPPRAPCARRMLSRFARSLWDRRQRGGEAARRVLRASTSSSRAGCARARARSTRAGRASSRRPTALS